MNGKLLATYDNEKAACLAVGYKWPTNLRKSLQKQGRKVTAGFVWKYAL
jgi:hypothetical protein